jgi:predicted phage terminase large subunit-like protein
MKNDLNNGIRELQKDLARKSLKIFATKYFAHYCKVNFAPFHIELFDYLAEMTLNRGRQLAIAAPRGNAKSSIVSLIYVLWCICYGYEKCIVIFSSTRKQSEKLLSHAKEELSSNFDLIRDFPEVCERPNPRWRNDEIITKNKINIMSSSIEHGIRGIRHQESRPGLIVLDDVESTESIRSQEQREKTHEWFTKVVLNLGSESTNYIAVGTVLHFHSLLAKIISKEEFPGWEKKIYKSVVKFSSHQYLWDKWEQIYCGKELYAEDSGPGVAKKFFEDNKDKMLEGTEVLWLEKESYYDLMLMRAQKGSLSFDSEKQNEPRDTSGLSIDMNKAVFWEDKHQGLDELQAFLGTRKAVLGACDPSVGKTNRSNYSAVVTVFMEYTTKSIYVVDADVGRWDINTLLERICLHHKAHNFNKFVFEANGSQGWIGDFIKQMPTTIPAEPVTNMILKEFRIMKLMLLIEQGRVKLSRRLTELNRELEQYPYGAHDDAVDALSMIIDIAENFSVLTPEIVKAMFAKFKPPTVEEDSGCILKLYDGPFKHYWSVFRRNQI